MHAVALFRSLVLCIALPLMARSQANQDTLTLLAGKLGEDLIRNKHAVGLSIGVFQHGKKYFYNFGSTSKDELTLPTENTQYEIGSITKTFVSYVLAQQVLWGQIELEADIRKWLPGNYPNLAYKDHPVMICHLANTTSLLPDWLPALPDNIKNLPPEEALQAKIKAYGHLTNQNLLMALRTVQPDTIPGTRRYHSNAAAQLLAYILEEKLELPLEKVIANMITSAWSMKNTYFPHTDRGRNMASGYTAGDKEAVNEFTMPYFQYAGGMVSTTRDLVEYIQMLLDKRNQTAQLTLAKTAEIDAATGKVVELVPEGLPSPRTYSVALNWFKYQPDATHYQIWADGGTNGFNSYLVLYPLINSGVVLLANKSDEQIFRALPAIAAQIGETLRKTKL